MNQVRNIFLLLFSVCLLAVPVTAWSAYYTTLTNSYIDSVLARYFPQREYTASARVTLYKPEVLLTKGASKITLMIPIDAKIPDQPLHQGHAKTAVTIIYNPANGGVYLSNPKILKFEMPDVSSSLNKSLNSEIDTIIKNALPLIRIYQLDEKDLNHSLVKSMLKSFSIGNDNIRVEFGFE
jgi:hypothetical protein